MEKVEQDLREVSDTQAAAFLAASNVPILGTKDTGRNGVIFLFPDSPRVQELLLALANGTASADPIKLFAAWRTVRTLIQGGRR
jgi:hypothetical protein